MNMVVAGLVIVVFCSLAVMYFNLGKSDVALKSRERVLEGEVRSAVAYVGFNSTNVTDVDINVTIYVKNAGAVNMLPRCCDLIIDGVWVLKNHLTSYVAPQVFDPGLWNPSETLLMSTVSDFDVGEHNFTFISCAGDKFSGRFNASKCGDGICLGGEYCDSDDIACDSQCYTSLCQGGCIQNPIPAGLKDNFGVVCNETGGCATGDCVCDGVGGCCGAPGSACTIGSECCSGSCSGVCA